MAWRYSRLFVAPVSAGLFLMGASLATAAGTQGANQDWFQNQPPQPPASAPAAAVNGAPGRDSGGPNAMPPAPPPPVQPPPRARAPQQYMGGQSDFPDDEVHDWVVAYARAAHARAMFHQAENELDNAVRNAKLDFEQSREFAEATAAEKKAYDAYTAERRHALSSVVGNPKYVAALELRDKMGGQIAYLRGQARRSAVPVPHELLLAMASQKLQYATDAHNMENAALDRDSALRDARQRMVQASARVSALRTSFDASVRNNPEILQARRDVETARVALITAEAYRDAAGVAGSLATNYSYYRHRWDGLAAPLYANPWVTGFGY